MVTLHLDKQYFVYSTCVYTSRYYMKFYKSIDNCDKLPIESFLGKRSLSTAKIANKMRRTNTNYSYEPVPTTSSHNALEEENERMTEHLKDKIHALKSLSIDIGNEVQYQDKILHGMDDDFERTHGSLTGSIARVLRLSKGSHTYYIIYLVLFSIVVFFILWVTLKFF